MSKNENDTASIRTTKTESENYAHLMDLFKNSPLDNQIMNNFSLFMTRQALMRLFFFKEMYEKIVNTHGVIMEFGCKWGTNLSLFTALRGIYEPYNHNRTILGFDTFEGLKGVSDVDGGSKHIDNGFYSTSAGYDEYLTNLLSCLEGFNPISHIKKHKIIKGDVRETLKHYLEKNPQTVIAFAYFDMDIYEPTKVAMELIKPYITKGTVIGIDEMNWDMMPGPTIAFDEVFGRNNYKIVHSPLSPIPGYVVIE